LITRLWSISLLAALTSYQTPTQLLSWMSLLEKREPRLTPLKPPPSKAQSAEAPLLSISTPLMVS
jgi:hypothetical protein